MIFLRPSNFPVFCHNISKFTKGLFFSMNKFKETFLKILPKFSWLPLFTIVVLQIIVYGATKKIALDWHHYVPSLSIDNYIPFIPFFIIPYVACYVHWIANFVMSAQTGKNRFNKFTLAVIISQIVCGIVFLAFPTTIDRPNIENIPGFNGFLLHFIYNMDTPVNLFPSMHCLHSWFSWIAVRNCKQFPKWYKVFSLLFGIVVCISTVTIKQHFFIDIIAGIALAELSWLFVNKVLMIKREHV